MTKCFYTGVTLRKPKVTLSWFSTSREHLIPKCSLLYTYISRNTHVDNVVWASVKVNNELNHFTVRMKFAFKEKFAAVYDNTNFLDDRSFKSAFHKIKNEISIEYGDFGKNASCMKVLMNRSDVIIDDYTAALKFIPKVKLEVPDIFSTEIN